MAQGFDTLGFNVFREANGARVKLNDGLVPAKALSGGAGERYSFVDPAPPESGRIYWVENVTFSLDSRWYGPVAPVAAPDCASIVVPGSVRPGVPTASPSGAGARGARRERRRPGRRLRRRGRGRSRFGRRPARAGGAGAGGSPSPEAVVIGQLTSRGPARRGKLGLVAPALYTGRGDDRPSTLGALREPQHRRGDVRRPGARRRRRPGVHLHDERGRHRDLDAHRRPEERRRAGARARGGVRRHGGRRGARTSPPSSSCSPRRASSKTREGPSEGRSGQLRDLEPGVSQAGPRRAPAHQRDDRADAPVPAGVRALLQQPAGRRSRGARAGAVDGRAQADPRRAGRRGRPVAAVHGRRDLRARRLPRHLQAREVARLPHHAVHERHADHPGHRRHAGRMAAVRRRDHPLRPHARDLRTPDGRPGLVRSLHARHSAAQGARAAA